jgi:two-component system, LytTR family, response regulator
MLKAIIVDDEALAIDSLAWEIREYCPQIEIVKTCCSAEEAMQAIDLYQPDVVFLDIDMPRMSGLDMLVELGNNIKGEVIFTTAFDHYALHALKASAFDYLLKPVDGMDISKVVARLEQNREIKTFNTCLQSLIHQLEPTQTSHHKIALPTTARLEFVLTSDILYCETAGEGSKVVLKNRQLIVNKPLRNLEQLLPTGIFCRTHTSFVINLEAVESYIKGAGGTIILSNQVEIPVSQRFKEGLMLKLKVRTEEG